MYDDIDNFRVLLYSRLVNNFNFFDFDSEIKEIDDMISMRKWLIQQDKTKLNLIRSLHLPNDIESKHQENIQDLIETNIDQIDRLEIIKSEVGNLYMFKHKS